MNPSNERKSTRMRHLHDDDALVFPKRPTEPVSLDVDSTRHARVFSEDVMSGIHDPDCGKSSSTGARFMVIGGIFCFLFLLVMVSIHSSLNEQQNIKSRDTLTEADENLELGAGEEILEEEHSEGLDTVDEIVDEIPPAENKVIDKTDDLAEVAATDGGKEVFIMDVNGIRFEIGIDRNGDFDLPAGLSLNPHVRQHWALIQTSLGIEYYDDDYNGEITILDDQGKLKLEPPLPSEDESWQEDQVDNSAVKVRMPEGLLFEAPSATEEHVHGEGCDPVAVDVNTDDIDENIVGDKTSTTDEKLDI